MRTTRTRGFSLVELLVAMALAGILSTFLLAMTRSQLIAYEMNDQITRAQQNGRAGVEFLEQSLRRACGGISAGRVTLNGPDAPVAATACVRVWDGAKQKDGSFEIDDPATKADAVEILYGTTPLTAATTALNTATPSVTVADTTGFAVGDFVLVTNFLQGAAFKISSVAAGAPGTLTFASPSGALLLPSAIGTLSAFVPAAGDSVMRLRSIAIYRETTGVYADMLMLDPDGMLGANHNDAEPLVDGVEDLQLAIGVDANGDGLINTAPDEWAGNNNGELHPLPALPWNQLGASQVRQVRATLLVRTMNRYPGVTVVEVSENRTAYPASTGGNHRYRALRLTVAPRGLNLLN